MAFGRYRGTSSFDSSPTDAGSTILKLTNKILADLQVDNSSSQQAEARVVRNVRSYSDPSGGVDARESLPAYYDTSTILQPAVRLRLILKPTICFFFHRETLTCLT